MGCKKSHIRDPKSMLGSGVTTQEKGFVVAFVTSLSKIILIFQIFFLVVGSCVHPTDLKKYHWSLHYKNTTPRRPWRPWMSISTSLGFLGLSLRWDLSRLVFGWKQDCFGEKLGEVVWLFKGQKNAAFVAVSAWAEIFCAVVCWSLA